MPTGVYDHSEHSKFMKKLWQDPSYRKKQANARKGIIPPSRKGCKQSEEAKEKIGKAHRGKIISKWHKRRIGKANSKNMKKLWQNSEYVAKQMKARHVAPNKPEKFLDKLLQNLFPGEYKFVGDGEFILAGKCPDFVNVNGQKKIIELFGDYWHKPEEEQQRTDLFARYGYQTLIIWEHELKNENIILNRIKEFNCEKA